MENNNQNLNNGPKGVFPGTVNNPPNVNPPIQNPQYSEEVAIAPNVPESINTNINPEAPVADFPDAKTYIKLETKNPDSQVSGVIEIDLISFRERGQESRYLSINTIGVGKEGVQSETTISIDNEIDFKRLKDFISNLNWND